VPIVVDFPDGHVRGLLSAELLVDGVVVASTAATSSLTSLTWPLAAYADSADHVLQAHIIDELGLAAETDQITVNVSVQVPAAVEPPPAPIRLLQQPGVPLAALALSGLAVALGIGALAWWSVSRRNRAPTEADAAPVPAAARPRPALEVKTESAPIDATLPALPTRPSRSELVNSGPPLKPAGRSAPAASKTQPISHPPRPGLLNSRAVFRWPGGRSGTQHHTAYLEVVEAGGGSASRADIELVGEVLTLGRDGALAETVFHDRSVSRLHARIVALNGVFLIYDAGSTSGTWVNYTPLPAETGHALQPGDLINLGRVQLRFKRSDTPVANGARVARVAPTNPAAPTANGNGHHSPTSTADVAQLAEAHESDLPPPADIAGTVEKPE
jgi:hypothetical protein